MPPSARVVLFVSHTGAWGGGGEIVLQQLAFAARTLGYSPHLVCPEGELASRLAPDFDAVECVALPWLRRSSRPRDIGSMVLECLRVAVRLIRIVKKSDPVILHANSGAAVLAAWFPAALFRRPLIWHQHDIVPSRRVNRVVLGFCARFCTTVLATSETVAHSLEGIGIPRDRVQVFYPRIRDNFVRPPQSKAACRSELGLPAESFIVGLVGRVVPRKGHDVFLRAVAELVRDGVDVRAVILGDVPSLPTLGEPPDTYANELRSLASQAPLAGRVTFCGHRDDVPEILSTFDVLVVPSWNEPFGIVILEAFALGIPVVASTSGGPSEIIDDERTGLLVPPGDVNGFARALRRLNEEPSLRERLVDRAHLRLVADFSEDGLVSQLACVYTAAIRGSEASV